MFQSTLATRLLSTITVASVKNVSGKSQKVIGYWLAGCSGMVFVAVMLGM